MSTDIFYNLIGLAGMVLFLVAYALLQTGRINAQSLKYPLLNLLGAVLILISLIHDWNLPAFLLECAWLVISLYGVITYYMKKGR